MDTTMNNRTNKRISSNNRRKLIANNILTIFNILLLIAAITIAVMVLTGCSKEPDSYPEAETLVDSELENLKSADASDETLRSFTENVSGEFDGSMLEGYIAKLKDFDHEIISSAKAESDDGDAALVKVKITTYDFGNEYLKAWNEHMMQDEEDRWQSQFYSFLLLRLGSVTNKDYVTEVDVLCTDPKGDGHWETDLRSNEELMNAISGGMLNEIKNLVTDDVIIDNTELDE